MSNYNRCYAFSLNNCSGKISGEHPISSGILNIIGDTFQVSGLSWLQGKTKTLQAAALKSNILCSHHNNVLHQLDDMAISIFSTLKRFDEELRPNNLIKNEKHIVLGYIMERWFVKLYLGLHWGGHFSSKLKQIEPYLLENLFLDKRLPNHFGLYFGLPLGSQVQSFNGLSISTFNSQTMDICAIACEIVGIPFYISIRPGKLEGTGMIDAPAQYHPIGIELKSPCHSVTKEIMFIW